MNLGISKIWIIKIFLTLNMKLFAKNKYNLQIINKFQQIWNNKKIL